MAQLVHDAEKGHVEVAAQEHHVVAPDHGRELPEEDVILRSESLVLARSVSFNSKSPATAGNATSEVNANIYHT